ncbi:NAD(P)-binding protein [Stipitochalara longipes BDJ]|nr:NAD(P)-binding protein [Stipitochalara longipes BDJ]
MTSSSRIAIVTGANKGIGLAIVRNLALQYPKSSLNSGPLLIYLTARSTARGEEAVKTLLFDSQLKAAKALVQDGGLATIKFQTLDITDENSIQNFKELIEKEHPDGIDILINNAGIFMQASDVDGVKTLLKTNYYGTLAMMKAFLPLFRPAGRLVNVASMDGQLELYSESLKQAFVDASRTSAEACTVLIEKFPTALLAKKEREEGWPSIDYAYPVSKAGEIAATKAVALEAERTGEKVLINSCCPGFVNTDMTRGHGVLTVDEGAKMPVLLALGDIGEATGGFWREGVVVEW